MEKHDFILLFDVRDGNPNGDPDANNMPRTDPLTGQGLITDGCIKRKIRNYVSFIRDEIANRNLSQQYDIYCKEKSVYEEVQAQMAKEMGLELTKKGKNAEQLQQLRNKLLEKFYDIRTFGAVLPAGKLNVPKVTGPVQISFARSVDPINVMTHTITSTSVASIEESKNSDGFNQTFGQKHTVTYGLYLVTGHINGGDAIKTGFSQDDLNLFWEALDNMFEYDRSSARGEMTTRKLIIFKHPSYLGKCKAQECFDRVNVTLKDPTKTVTGYSDYLITLDGSDVSNGSTKIEVLV